MSRTTLASFAERYPDHVPASLTTLLGAGESERRQAIAWIESLPVPEKVDMLRAALWSSDGLVARGAAFLTKPQWLDVAESRRVAELLLSTAVTLPQPFDITEFGAMLTPKDISRELLLDVPIQREAVQFLPGIHHSLRQEHLPLLAAATRADDLLLRQDALQYLAVLANYTDHPPHRDLIALAVLAWNEASTAEEGRDPTSERIPASPLAVRLPASQGAIPRTLAALLRRLWLQPVPPALEGFRAMARRWLVQTRATADDHDLLAEFAETDDHELTAIVARSFGDSDEPAIAIRRFAWATHADETVRAIAISALAKGGSQEHLEALKSNAFTGSVPALAELLRHGSVGSAAIADWLATAPPEVVNQRCKALASALDPARTALHPRPPEALWRLRDALDRRPPVAGGATVLIAQIPQLRSDRLCTAAIKSLETAEFDADVVSVLALFDRDLLTDRLRAASVACRDLARKRRLDAARAQIGDPWDAPGLLAIFDSQRDLPRTWLARSQCPELRTMLDERLNAATRPDDERAIDAIETIAVMEGMDPILADSVMREIRSHVDSLNVPRSVEGLIDRAKTLGAEAALSEYVAMRPRDAGVLRGSGSLAKSGVLAWLMRAREDRSSGRYREAILECARAGEPSAVAELRQAQTLELYRWIDDLPADAFAIAEPRPDPVRWYPMLAGNCCSYAAVASRLESWYEIDGSPDETGLRSRMELLRENFQDTALEWRLCPLQRRYFRFPKS